MVLVLIQNPRLGIGAVSLLLWLAGDSDRKPLHYRCARNMESTGL